mgnify:CR=1 FL=1
MEFLTNEKLTIVGAGGMIGSNMAQTAAMMRLTPNICLQDVYEPALQGVYEEMRHCGFEGMNFTYTTDSAEALKDAKYVISSGGAARKAGMTREDLLKGNAQVAEQLGKDIKAYCPDCKHVVIIFNPADITGLITLIYSGLKPSQVTTLAALDSTRLQSELAKYFKLPQSAVTGCSTFGGHGEQMAVFASTAKVDGTPLTDLIGTPKLPAEEWAALQQRVIKGGVMDGAVLSADGVDKLASLESREVLLAKTAGAIKASLSKAAYLFAAPASKAVRTVDALREKQETAA